MEFDTLKRHLSTSTLFSILLYLLKWTIICAILGVIVGSISAFFLISLDWVTTFRELNIWIITLLPIGGLIIGLSYHYWGTSVVKGNNLLLEQFHNPTQIIPFKMAPLVLFGTLVTHLFGGSAGREGTAVQIGGAVADSFTKFLGLHNVDRKILLIAGISAGFSSVFGTPLAGAIFALEVLIIGRIKLDAIVPSFLAAILADYFCRLYNIPHIHYDIGEVVSMNPVNLFWTLGAGILFGLTALLFSRSTKFWSVLFSNKINYPPLRPFLGGTIIAIAVFIMGTTKYIGLGIPTIIEAFNNPLPSYDFLIKILFTSFTLGAGFKGGEVTPLFFIGATLGNALFWFIPLPMGLLAAMGFVAVFAGATNTPIACTIMGLELFGIDGGLFLGLACVTAFLCSGKTGIYESQLVGYTKGYIYNKGKNK